MLIALALVVLAQEPTLLDFHADWCGPCQQMRTRIALLEQRGYVVKSINVDEDPETAATYRVSVLPTFILLGPDGKVVARFEGVQLAETLARAYLKAKGPPAVRSLGGVAKPWESAVRIKVKSPGLMGYGSGTIISSDGLILTCAHVFAHEGEITVDLFDGNLVGKVHVGVHYADESYPGELIDKDFNSDVALARIRPNRQLPYSRVVPVSWEPGERMEMITVGCSGGRDATVWSTWIKDTFTGTILGRQGYSGIVCNSTPKQGRSGGGLFTTDHYVAGVCNFAPVGRAEGIYAHPKSIHRILEQNGLSNLFRSPVMAATPPPITRPSSIDSLWPVR